MKQSKPAEMGNSQRAMQTPIIFRNSLWGATASVPATPYPRLTTRVIADVAIVGGGFTGLSAALHLAEKGKSVCLVEAEDIGYGASGRNGGQVNPGLKMTEDPLVRRIGEAGRRLFKLGEEATDFLADLVSRKGLRCGFIRPGLIRLAHNKAALATITAAYRALNERGIAARLLDARAVEEMVGTRRYVGGLLDPRGGSVQPLELVRELARVAVEAGAQIYVRTLARALTRTRDGWTVQCGEGEVHAGSVIVATNGYTDGLVPGLARSLLPVNSFQVATEPLSEGLDRRILPGGHAVYDSRRLVLYFRKSPDGRVMLGGRASFSSVGGAAAPTRDYDVLANVLRGIFPQLQNVAIAYRWTGLVCVTPDHLPHYHTPQPGLHIVLGYNGRGVALANRAGAWIAHKIIGVRDSGDIPATAISTIPLHSLREPALNVAMQWNRFLDVLGR